jgi:hypothetical protein
VFQACLDREIKAGSIRTGLAARYDFSKHFEQLVASAFQSQLKNDQVQKLRFLPQLIVGEFLLSAILRLPKLALV